MDELTRLSDRIVTLYEGRLTGEFAAPDYDPATLGFYMTGDRGGPAAGGGEEERA